MSIDWRAEQAELITWFKDVMPGKWKEFSGDNASDLARALASQQEERWRSIFEQLEINRGGRWSDLIVTIQAAIERTEPARITHTGNAFVVDRAIPLIVRDIDSRAENRILNNQFLTVAYISLRCGAVIPFAERESLFGLLLSSAVARLEIYETTAENISEDEHIKDVATTAANDYLEKCTIQLNTLDSNVRLIQEKVQQNLETSIKAAADLAKMDQEREIKWEAEKIGFVEDIRREALETAEVKASIELWSTKAKSHEITFWVGSALFVVALAAVSVWLVTYGIPFVQFVAKTFTGGQQYFGIALLVIPTLATAWIIRFIAKIALENLALAQDARQRHTQILTYLRMLGDSDHSMSRDERILALAAIFRPFIGQGADDISPPTVADLVREAIQGAARSK